MQSVGARGARPQYVENTGMKWYKMAAQNRNSVAYQGEPFWIGAADVDTGKITEVHTYEEAQAHDFHHSQYFSDEATQAMRENRWGIFWVGPDGSLAFDMFRRDDREPDEEVIHAIKAQVESLPQETPPPWQPAKPMRPLEGD